MTNTYDAIGRITQRRLGLNSNYDTALTYKPGADGSQTALLATYQNGGDTPYSYEYDANGNITEITQGNVSVTYSYNAANELVRENNGFTNQTVTYTYDNWGNLTEKNVYAYTTATDPGTPTQTIPYGYTNTAWGDQLTSYDGTSITYDSMGNPLTYRGYTLGWRGKQLVSASNGTDTIAYAYDENGLRTQKNVSGTTTNYYYNGSILMSLVTGNDTLLFSYDASGKVVAVNYNGTYYYYLRNGQGDVVKLIDNSGATVVEYSYDTWGKQLSCTGSLASTLGALNPFRYRGYVYDEETQWYYLQSRYYNPEVCRFLSADSQIDRNAGIIGYNLYAYCANNPIIFQDDSGCGILEKIIGFFEMMVFGGGGNIGGPWAGRDDTKYDEYQNVEDQRRSTPSSQNNNASQCSSTVGEKYRIINGCEVYGSGHGEQIHYEQIEGLIEDLTFTGEYITIYGNRALNTAGLYGTQRPDIIAIDKTGSYYVWEIASKSQMSGIRAEKLKAKVRLMQFNNPQAHFQEIIPWAGKE